MNLFPLIIYIQIRLKIQINLNQIILTTIIPQNLPNITYNQNNNPAISGKYPDNNFKRNSTPQTSQVIPPPTKNEPKPSKKINEMLKIFDKSK